MAKMKTLTINGVQYEIEDDGAVRVVDEAFNAESGNPVANKIITAALTAAAQQLTAMDEAITALQENTLPAATTADNGKFLRVVDGVWAAVAVTNAEEESF